MTIKTFIFKVIFLIICGIGHLTQAKDDVKVFITIKQDCSNCNLVAYVYKQVASKYKTQLVFKDISKKELKFYLREVIVLPDTISYILSDSIMKVLDDFSKGLGAFVYAYKNNECVYAANLKSFNMERMNQAVAFEKIKYEVVPIPDSIAFLNYASTISNKKFYCLYDYTLNKVYIFSLPDYKLESVITDKTFNEEELWQLTFNNTVGLDSARKICQKLKAYMPDSKMIRIDGVSCDKEDVYLWISLFKPKFHPINGQTALIVDYKIALLVKYHPQKKFTYYTIDPIIDPENKRMPIELSQNPSTYYFKAPFDCMNICIVDSILYLGIYKDKEVKDRPEYPMAVYKFTQNKIQFLEFYKTELPKINTFENTSNSFIPISAGNPIVYFTSSPYYYYLDIAEKKFTLFSFLPKQNIKLSDTKSVLWVIGMVVLKDNQTLLCIEDKIAEHFYIIKLKDDTIIEKYRICLPKITSNLVLANDCIVGIDEKKENIFKIPISSL